jgi:Domain of unknown function (DUF4224)
MSLYLDDEELQQLTGTKRRRLQVEWLEKNGFVFSLNRVGEPVLATAYVLAKLGVATASSISKRVEPNFANATAKR